MVEFFTNAENIISGLLPLSVLMVSGVYFTFKTRGVQFRKFFKAISFSLCVRKGEKGEISSFGAVCNSLAATVGTGNIAGVAAAISIGGAGAVFWMWVSAFVGMVVKAVEITVAIALRQKTDGGFLGGPMYYIKQKMGKIFTPLAVVFAVFCLLSSFATGNITQVNSCVSVVQSGTFSKLAVGVGFSVVVAFVIMGGAKKITRFTSALIPFMAVLYIVLCLGVLIKNANLLGDAFLTIFKGAFCPRSVTGGAVGSFYVAMITGVQKGIFSNEAGLGTAGMAHSVAIDAKKETQWLFGIFEVFVDTVLICTLTALTILCSGVIIDYGSTASSELVGMAFSTLYGDFSKPVLAVMLGLFAVSSVLGWGAYGISAADFLWGKKGERAFKMVYPGFCFVGAVIRVDAAFRMAEFFNAVMLMINVFSVLYLCKNIMRFLKGDGNEKKSGKFAKTFAKR